MKEKGWLKFCKLTQSDEGWRFDSSYIYNAPLAKGKGTDTQYLHAALRLCQGALTIKNKHMKN